MQIEPVTRRRAALLVVLSFLVAGTAVAVMPLIGSAHIDYSRAFARLDPDRQILFELRLPRVLLASLAGGALATGIGLRHTLWVIGSLGLALTVAAMRWSPVRLHRALPAVAAD